jgi:hypothetical protein
MNIRTAFDEVRAKARPEDTLLVYFSGHGVVSSANRDTWYYLTADARTLDIDQDPALRDISTVSSSELFEWLREPVKTMPLKQVVILDTCAAGAAGDELKKLAVKRDVPPDQRRAIELLKDATGTYILMGSAADAVSYETNRYSEGLLTYSLLKGMRGAALDEGSRLEVTRWFHYASEQVPQLAQSIGGIQKPEIAAPRGTGFPIALLPLEDRKQIPIASVKPELLRATCLDSLLLDSFSLCEPVRERLRDISYPQARGEEAREAPVAYFDAVVDDLPGALRPQLLYTVADSSITVRVRMIREEKLVAEQAITASSSDKSALAAQICEKILAMAQAQK